MHEKLLQVDGLRDHLSHHVVVVNINVLDVGRNQLLASLDLTNVELDIISNSWVLIAVL